jgi:hypothetical protein
MSVLRLIKTLRRKFLCKWDLREKFRTDWGEWGRGGMDLQSHGSPEKLNTWIHAHTHTHTHTHTYACMQELERQRQRDKVNNWFMQS